MIHVRIDNPHSTALNIYVDISPIQSSTPTIDKNIYDHLFHSKTTNSSQPKVAYVQPLKKKNYTLQQILDHVETVQQQYEQIVHHRDTSSSTTSSLSCFFPIKHLTKILKNRRIIKTKTHDSAMINTYSKEKSPFIFGGETLQWIALPRQESDDDNHIYENEFFS